MSSLTPSEIDIRIEHLWSILLIFIPNHLFPVLSETTIANITYLAIITVITVIHELRSSIDHFNQYLVHYE